MAATLALYRTSIGKKAVMAVTGAIFYLYMIAHIYGNLKIFAGAQTFNAYAEFLRAVGEPVFFRTELLWIVRVVLLAALVLHVTAAVQLARQSYAGRPTRYRIKRDLGATFASRTMRWGGLALFLFVVFHILDLTIGAFNPRFVVGDAYGNLVRSFSRWPVALIYIAAMIALGLHLYHGVWSMFQTLGVNRRKYDRFFRGLAAASAIVLAGTGALIPLAVLVGIVA